MIVRMHCSLADCITYLLLLHFYIMNHRGVGLLALFQAAHLWLAYSGSASPVGAPRLEIPILSHYVSVGELSSKSMLQCQLKPRPHLAGPP